MRQKENWNDLKKHARWDRIFGAGVVLLLLLLCIIGGIRSCSKKNQETDTVSDTTATEETSDTQTIPASVEATSEETETSAIADNSMAIYLSPSTQANQPENQYACDTSVTEADAMWSIAQRVQSLLEADGYQVYLCGQEESVMDKVKEGNQLQCGAYVAIYSNAGIEAVDGEGTEIFYNSEIEGSMSLAENIYNRVAELTPTTDRGIKDQNQRDLYEIEWNTVPCCLLEIEYHNKVDTSQWILDNTANIALEITKGIEAYFQNKMTGVSG